MKVINYTVQAEVFDIQSYLPKQDDIFLVDTNVWYWLTYTQASTSALSYQTNVYPSYLTKAISVQASLRYCGLSLAELAHNIETTERKIFSATIKAKDYRHNHPSQRANVVAEVQTAWSQVTPISSCIDITVDDVSINKSLVRLQTQPLDGYDLLILEAIAQAGIVKVITDDGDYVTVPGIKVFTANRNAIAAAANQGKLWTR